jgi:hypothetical protein
MSKKRVRVTIPLPPKNTWKRVFWSLLSGLVTDFLKKKS